MNNGLFRNKKYFLGTILCILFFISVFFLILFLRQSESYTIVSFLDVGQGDAIFIEAPNGRQVLIDAGSSSSVVSKLSEVMPFWDRKIDMILPTHADKDHIGGFPEILRRYTVRSIYDTSNTATTSIYEYYAKARDEEGAVVRIATSKDTIVLDKKNGVYLRVLFPISSVEELERNDASTIVQLVYGDMEVLLTGDAGTMIEDYLVYLYGDNLESEILKAGHHGSKTSTSELFLQTVSPRFVVVSAGEKNSYGHPHQEVVERIRDFGSTLLQTSQEGTIQFAISPEDVWVK